jgi:hypothetical protein
MDGRGLLTLATAGLAVALTACGGGKDPKKEALLRDSSAQPKTLIIAAEGTAKDVEYSVPAEVPPGMARIVLRNDAQGSHAVQLIRIDGDHTPEEGLKAAAAWFMGRGPLPDWLHAAGGTPVTKPRALGTSVQSLVPGKYFMTDTESKGPPKVNGTFEVTGDRDQGNPVADARIEAFEYGFRAEKLRAGKVDTLIDNKGDEPHFVEAVPLRPGKGLADVRRYLQDDSGEPPAEFKKSVSTPVLDGKTRQVVTLELQKGQYALLCFVPDRAGGPPHAFQGMVAEVQVR